MSDNEIELGEDEEWVYEDDWLNLRDKRGCTYKHKEYFSAFIDNFLLNPGSPTQALRDAGYPSEKNINMISKRMYDLLKPFIMDRFEEHKKKFALLGHQLIVKVSQDEEAPHREKLQAGKLLMDYGGHAPAQRVEIDMTVDISDVRQRALDRINIIDGEVNRDDTVVINKDDLIRLQEMAGIIDGEV